MNRQVSGRPGAAARMIVATLLAGAFICAALPLASVSAGNLCRLECCAARAPHAAGSCMNGACHAAVQIHKHTLQRSSAVAPAEKLCGLQTFAKRLASVAKLTDAHTTDESVASLAPPCNADCGSCAVSSVSAKHKITIAAAYRLQPQRTTWSVESALISSHEISARQYSPRGPPTTPS
jgi:hypothetical protein